MILQLHYTVDSKLGSTSVYICLVLTVGYYWIEDLMIPRIPYL